MVVTLAGIVTVVSFVQRSKAPALIVVTFAGIVIDARLEQPRNALRPIVVSWLLGAKVTVARDEQPPNASSPMLATPAGILIDLRAGQLLKDLMPIVVTPAGIVIVESLMQPTNASLPIVVSLLPFAKFTVVSVLQFTNAALMVWTFAGIVIDARDEQLKNALRPIVVTLAGIVIEFRFPQLLKTLSPIVVRLLLWEKVTVASLVQPWKARFPILVTLAGILIDLRFVKPKNVSSPMIVTVSGILTLSTVLFGKVFFVVLVAVGFIIFVVG